MKRAALFFLGLIAFSSAFEFRGLSSKSLSLSTVTTNGEIPLTSTETGHFVVTIDLEDTRGNRNGLKEAPKSVPMTPIFYKSHSLLVQECLGFSPYNCFDYDCRLSETPVEIDYLNFHSDGVIAETNLFMDYTQWKLSKVFIAEKCTSKASEKFGTGSYGYIAMGTAENFDENYIGNKEFSVYLENDGKSGKISFNWNASLAEPQPLVVLGADKNWQVTNVAGISVGGKQIIPLTDKPSLIFDINSDLLRFPESYYQIIIEQLKNVGKVECISEKNSMPVCKLNNMIKTLPTFILNSDNDKDHKGIVLPPQLYVVNGNNDSFVFDEVTLNIQQTSPNVEGDAYVQVGYSNHIILGSSFMRYYITKFDIGSSTIAIYNKSAPSGSSAWIFILLALVVVGGIIGFFIKTKSKGNNYVYEENGKSSLLN